MREDLALGDALGEQLAQERTPCLAGGNQGVAVPRRGGFGLHKPGGSAATPLELQQASVGTAPGRRRRRPPPHVSRPPSQRGLNLVAQGASLVDFAAIMGWSRSTAAARTMRYGHLFAAQEERLTDAVEQAYGL
jgi:hypothetical protein